MLNWAELKKVVSVSFLFLLLLMMVTVTLNWTTPVAASPGTLEVGPSSKYSTIQDAIDNASSGDLIFVHNDVYFENIIINKSVSIVGEDRDQVVVNGSEVLVASGVMVKDLTVRASSSIQSPFTIYSAGNVLEDVVIENGFYGLQLLSSYGNVISNNIISSNQYGVYMYTSDHNVFSFNSIVNNVEAGVEVHSSGYNVFSGNTLYNNTDGLNLYSSNTSNIFYHNNFSNTLQLSTDSVNSTNVWSLNGEGNYWSDYTGQDINSDGIGDIPFNTDTVSGDTYPLMGPFYDLESSLAGQTYHVYLVSNSSISGLRFTFGQETGNKIVFFNVAGEEGTIGFGRIMIPLGLMGTPFIILGDQGEITPRVLSSSNATNIYLYFTWSDSNQSISIISSKTLQLYNDLLGEYNNLLAEFSNLTVTQSGFLANYSTLLDNMSNLESKYFALNSSYYSHLSDYSRNMENLQNLIYVFAATTAIFLIATVYLSRGANTGGRRKFKGRENAD